MVRVIMGRAGTGKTAQIYEEIKTRVGRGESNIALIVPEQYTHEAERELCAAVGDTLSLHGEVLSFTGLSRRVFAKCGIRRQMMDRGGRVLCMAVAMNAVSSRLRVYQKYAGQPRMLEQLVRAAEQVQNAGLHAEHLAEAAEKTAGQLQDKLWDLANILEAYNTARAGSRADPSEVLELLAEKIGSVTEPGAVYYIDGFTDFTVPQLGVVRELIRAGADLTVCLTCEEGSDGQSLFGVPLKTRRQLRQLAESYGESYSEETSEPGEETPLRFYCSHLFDFAQNTMDDPEHTVRLVSGADVYEECELAASRMAELARGGARWRDMALAVRGFEDYRAILESACARYDIPVFLSGRGDMLRRSIPLLISAVLEAVDRGCEYEPVFAALKTGLFVLDEDECDRLENYVLRWNIRGELWNKPFRGHPDGYNKKFDEAAQTQLDELNELRERVAEPLRTLREASRAASTAEGQAKALADFLIGIELPKKLELRAKALEEQKRPETAAEYARVWELVCTALEQFAAVLGDMKMDTRRFREMFCLMLSCYDVTVIPVSLDRVQAGDMSSMRRRHIKHLLVLGASDTRVPAPDDGSGVFTQEEREELTGLGLELGTAEEDYSRELGRIYNCLTLPSESLYISWPLADGSGEQTQPSLLAERASVLLGAKKEQGDLFRARTFSEKAAFALAVRAKAGGAEEPCLAANSYFCEEGRGDEVENVVRAAQLGRGKLSPEAVEALYGKNLRLSPSGVEQFADCQFAYFLKYGLRAKERETQPFDPRDLGIFVHHVLENLVKWAIDAGGFRAVTAEQVKDKTAKLINEYIRTELRGFDGCTDRFRYLFERKRIALQYITNDTWQEMRQSKFAPYETELNLRESGLGELDEGLTVTGTPDRIDVWQDGDKTYIRVIDYKTGKKVFRLSDVCEGKDLQMLIYLFALVRNGARFFRSENLMPAGVLYCRARYDIIAAEADLSEADLEKKHAEKSRHDGLVLSDPAVVEAMDRTEKTRFLPNLATKSADGEHFAALGRYITGKLRKMADQMEDGSIEVDPWWESDNDTACTYCKFKHVCLRDDERDCWHKHPTREKSVQKEAQRAWAIITGEKEDDDNG